MLFVLLSLQAAIAQALVYIHETKVLQSLSQRIFTHQSLDKLFEFESPLSILNLSYCSQ